MPLAPLVSLSSPPAEEISLAQLIKHGPRFFLSHFSVRLSSMLLLPAMPDSCGDIVLVFRVCLFSVGSSCTFSFPLCVCVCVLCNVNGLQGRPIFSDISRSQKLVRPEKVGGLIDVVLDNSSTSLTSS